MELDVAYSMYRPLLFSIAYRMLGSVTNAEDLVQDTFVTLQQKAMDEEEENIRDLKAYLCKIVTNRCLDYLKSAKAKREVYIGPWLPEPLLQEYTMTPASTGAEGMDPLHTIELEDTVSYAFLVILERLTPVERAVFILREAFVFEYDVIADFLDKKESACRKMFSRLKRKIENESEMEWVANVKSEQLALRFLHAATTGEMEDLLQLLSEDVTLYSDGGGKITAAVKPIISNQRVLAFIEGLIAKGDGLESVRIVKVNGQPGLLIKVSIEASPTIVSLAFKNGRVQEIYVMRNPDKLRHVKSD
ncbi:RNA polymerase sigma-70 factor [Paenibacillus xylanilyticus]|uniref:RNA polymerase sigma-70 factor n=1 Tax=Paenibacillus xylanilyticus TaxID=248903 RepID=UPI0039A11D71